MARTTSIASNVLSACTLVPAEAQTTIPARGKINSATRPENPENLLTLVTLSLFFW